MAVSKRVRYEVLRRDNYTCRYCGDKAPDVPITVDHVVPRALGGSDQPDNLVAACKDCNHGKTSSSPDAPLVAQVSGDAMRWSRAMQAAAAEMLARNSGQVDAQAHFEKVWARFGHGSERTPIPKDPGWRQSVDSLLAAGLPMMLLEECVEIAMGQRKVTSENVFRYMCGVAWKKVTELQKSAQSYLGTPGQDSEAAPVADRYDEGRRDAADEVLDELTADLRDEFIRMVDDGGYGATCGDPQSDTDRLVSAAAYALGTYRADQSGFNDRAFLLFEQLPDGLGERVFKSARTTLYEHWGPDFSRALFISQCLHDLVDELRLAENEALIAELTSQEEGEYVAFVTLRFPEGNYSEAGWTARIADAIRAARAGDRAENMCCGPGNYTPFCPNTGDFMARIAELPCCTGEKTDPWHQGHRFCPKHKEALDAGAFRTPDGMTLTATESCLISETAPF